MMQEWQIVGNDLWCRLGGRLLGKYLGNRAPQNQEEVRQYVENISRAISELAGGWNKIETFDQMSSELAQTHNRLRAAQRQHASEKRQLIEARQELTRLQRVEAELRGTALERDRLAAECIELRLERDRLAEDARQRVAVVGPADRPLLVKR